MGQALLALTCASVALVAQERDPVVARERDALWEELFQSWGTEFREVKALRADPEQGAEADQRYRELVQRLADTARELAVPLYYETWTLGSDVHLTTDLEERLAWLELCSAAAETSGNESAVARAEQERALQLASAGRRAEACDALESALARIHQSDLRAYLLQDLAELRRRTGEPGRSLALLEELEGIVANDESLAGMQRAIDAIRSYAFVDLGLPDRAAGTIQRWLARAEERRGSAPEELLAARLAHAHWLLSVGDLEGAAESVARFLAEDLPGGDGARAELLLLLGTAEIGLEIEEPDREPRGEAHLAQALELGLETEQEAYARLTLAELGLARDDLAAAARELDAARGRMEAWRGGDARPMGTSPWIELATLDARLAQRRDDGPLALAAARARVAEVIGDMLEAWAQAPEREGGVGWLLYAERRALLGEYAELCVTLDGEEPGAERALEQCLEVEAMGTLARRSGIGAPTLDDVRAELLGNGNGILFFLPARGGSHAFALDRDGLEHERLAPSFEIEELRRRYLAHVVAGRSALLDPGQRAWALDLERSLATRLADLLLPPSIRARLATWRGVTIAGADSLGPLPWEWLPLGEAPYLGVALALDLLPSLPLGVAWSRRVPRAERACDLLLVGGALDSEAVRERWPELEPLPLDDDVVRRVSAPYESDRVRVLRAGEATRRGLSALDLGAVGVLQFLTHGVLERERERPLALVLSGDDADPGLFRCEDAERPPAPGLVVLAACGTAGGPARKGDPLIADMGGAWLSAGAQAVVLSRADLVWADAVRISSSLHRELADGRTPAEALRAARAELVADRGGEAPFHGGALTVVGLGHRPVFASKTPREPAGMVRLLVTAATALAAGVLLGALVRRRTGCASSAARREPRWDR